MTETRLVIFERNTRADFQICGVILAVGFSSDVRNGQNARDIAYGRVGKMGVELSMPTQIVGGREEEWKE